MTGTWEGFLTVVFDMYPSKTIPCCITLQAEYLSEFYRPSRKNSDRFRKSK